MQIYKVEENYAFDVPEDDLHLLVSFLYNNERFSTQSFLRGDGLWLRSSLPADETRSFVLVLTWRK